MRRFTAIFVKRDKNSDLSSSSSSTNSDHSPPPLWKSWIGAKRSSQNLPPQPIILVHHDTDEDSLSEEEDDEDEYDQNNIRIRIQNALAVNPHPNSPFVHHPDQPIFPRSTNRTNSFKTQSSTRIAMFNSHLLARLNSAPLSPSELSTILPFASRSAPSPIISILPSSEIARPPISSHIASASLGIQRWITRPCFEDRFAVYTPTDTTVQCRPVTSAMAIAALEYPDYLDIMADFDLSSPNPEKNVCNVPPVDSAPVDSAPAQSHGILPEFSATSVTPAHWRNSSTVVPSPLRIQHSPPSTKKDIPAVVSPTPKTTVKRIVRFAEEDDDDRIPLHMVRMKKKREDKANFLRLEQLKRAKEEEEERKRQDQEALGKERRRLAKEKEKRETDKAFYAEAIAAARLLREGHRTGTILPSNTTNSSNPLATSSSSASLRNSERNKPLMDSRKLFSKPPFDPSSSLSIPRRDNSDYHHQSDSSPGSSRSPSINHSSVSPNHLSRPPSMYSTHTSSEEEVRQQRNSKRVSVTPAAAAAVTSAPSSFRRPPIVSYPTWSGSSQTLPQVLPLPDLVHDMPLLPPTAPFMKHNRGSNPSTSSSRRGSLNSSNELANQLLPPQTTRSSSSRHHSSTAVPPPSRTKPERRPTHERRSSGDSTALSLHSAQHQQRPTPTSSQSQPVVSRGRLSLPSSAQYLQTPSAWPGLPSQNALMPMAMGYSPMTVYPVMFYPTGHMPTMQNVQMGSGGGGGGRIA